MNWLKCFHRCLDRAEEARIVNRNRDANLVHMSMEIPRLGWLFACARHKEAFVSVLRSAGIENAADMELIRRRFLAWLSQQMPAELHDHVNRSYCIACAMEARQIALSPWGAKLLEIAKAFSSPP